MPKHTCPDCGAKLDEFGFCQENFYQFLAWEAESLSTLGVVHHLMVLCYHLQHPGLYSPKGLVYSMQLLADFVEGGQDPERVRRQNRTAVDSSNRNWKIKGTSEAHANYPHPVAWQLTTTDVLAGGRENYVGNVKAWAYATLEDLRQSGYFVDRKHG